MPSPSDDEDQAGGPRGGRPQQRSVLRMDMNDLRGFQTLEKATLVGSVARQHLCLQMFPLWEQPAAPFKFQKA